MAWGGFHIGRADGAAGDITLSLRAARETGPGASRKLKSTSQAVGVFILSVYFSKPNRGTCLIGLPVNKTLSAKHTGVDS